MEQAERSRRARRDLLPAFLAAGAVGLAVTVVVGGTTADIEQADPPVPAITSMVAPPVEDAGISVQVRPARPRSTADAAAPAPALLTAPSLGSLLAPRPSTAVVRRPAPAAAVAVALPTVVPDGVVAAAATPATAVLAPPAATEPEPEVRIAAATTEAKGRRARLARVVEVPEVRAAGSGLSPLVATRDVKPAKQAAKAERAAAKADRKAAKHSR